MTSIQAELTPVQAHYLKKKLIQLQLNQELNKLQQSGGLGKLGHPFRTKEVDPVPISSYIFQNFVLTFPFLDGATQNFWTDKVQTFVDNFFDRNISSSDDREEATKRSRLMNRLERHCVGFLNASIKCEQKESTVEVQEVEGEAMSDEERDMINGYDINVVAVRVVEEKGRLNLRTHTWPEFIIRTARPGKDPIYVCKRYEDVETLRKELHSEYPEVNLPSIPSKEQGDVHLQESSGSKVYPFEKNRITMRSFLRQLVLKATLAGSPELDHFLEKNPIQLTGWDRDDVADRIHADRARAEEAKRFEEEANRLTEDLQEHWNAFKDELLHSTENVIRKIGECSTVEQLPLRYRKVLDCGTVSLAWTLYSFFMGEDNSSELFRQLKNMHSYTPYFLFKNAMKISNPMGIVRGMLDILLAQPFGQRSLIQRMFGWTLNDEVKAITKDVEALLEKGASTRYRLKLVNFVHLPAEYQRGMRQAAAKSGEPLVLCILTSDNLAPILSSEEMKEVETMRLTCQLKKEGKKLTILYRSIHEKYEMYHKIFQLETRKRDKTQLSELVFEGVTAELLKETLTIFYEPLARVYKAADISGCVDDFKNFAEDLIQTVEAVEKRGGGLSSGDTVRMFVDLVKRHQSAFYRFIHEVYTHDNGLFVEVVGWMKRFLDLLRSGFPSQIHLGDLIQETSQKTDVDVGELMWEIETLIRWNAENKRRQMLKMKRIGKVSSDSSQMGKSLVGNAGWDFIEEEDSSDSEDSVEEEHLQDGSKKRPEPPVEEMKKLLPFFEKKNRVLGGILHVVGELDKRGFLLIAQLTGGVLLRSGDIQAAKVSFGDEYTNSLHLEHIQ
ncbi:PX domain protein [Planoprotostelium fungivorum]|uniref:PX domain protein n=1 Tax=Planoprotostelium fungivorum TaxID=1890364 RepID=A0A2P6MZD1_9EUKA|nr:PX domain protein [Planoprotostelium fungivorum]